MTDAKVPNWNPYQTFTWTPKELRAFVDTYGERAFYNGKLWEIHSKKSAATGRRAVWFTEAP